MNRRTLLATGFAAAAAVALPVALDEPGIRHLQCVIFLRHHPDGTPYQVVGLKVDYEDGTTKEVLSTDRAAWMRTVDRWRDGHEARVRAAHAWNGSIEKFYEARSV